MPGLLEASPGATAIDKEVREATQQLKGSKSDPVVAFISKMVSVPEKDLPENRTKAGQTLTPEEARELGRKKRAEIARAQAVANGEDGDIGVLRDALDGAAIGKSGDQIEESDAGVEGSKTENERLIGFARLFSGTLEIGDEVYVLAPKFNPENPNAQPQPQKVTVTALYLLMGKELESLTSVPPGVVFGIAGLEGHVQKSATLCSQLEGAVNLAGVSMGGEPIVRVALEPENPWDLDKMIKGLKLLEQSDPCAAYEVLDSGEHVIRTAGELHLERCLKDLRERFARCGIQPGAPIVPYRETILQVSEMNPPKNPELPRGTVVSVVTQKQVTIRLRVRPLPDEATDYLLKNSSLIHEIYASADISASNDDDGNEESPSVEAPTALPTTAHALSALRDLTSSLTSTFSSLKRDRDIWTSAVPHIASFGPHRTGPNLLIDATPTHLFPTTISSLLTADPASNPPTQSPDLTPHLLTAFQLATALGPLCAEPTQGLAVFIEHFSTAAPADDTPLHQVTSQLIRATRAAIHAACLDWSPRLLLAMYSVQIQASAEVLGRVDAVVRSRRGRISDETMKEGTPFFLVTAELPVAESFGFADEIRKRTSGAAQPQLVFSGYKRLDLDPFWVPSTEEELEDLGEKGDKENVAKRYMDGVRERKGLRIEGRKLVVDAEKQKTLKR